MVKLFSKNSNLCDHNSPTLQTDRQTDRRTDRQTTCDRNTALCTKGASRGKKAVWLYATADWTYVSRICYTDNRITVHGFNFSGNSSPSNYLFSLPYVKIGPIQPPRIRCAKRTVPALRVGMARNHNFKRRVLDSIGSWSFKHENESKSGKTVNGSRYYRALESVSIASALSTALTIYPCQFQVHQR